jgi:hypothetical protein
MYYFFDIPSGAIFTAIVEKLRRTNRLNEESFPQIQNCEEQ